MNLSDYNNVFIEKCKPLIFPTFEDEVEEDEYNQIKKNQDVLNKYLPDIFKNNSTFTNDIEYNQYVQSCYQEYQKDINKFEFIPTIIIILKLSKIFTDNNHINSIINKCFDQFNQLDLENLSYDIIVVNNTFNRKLYDSFAIHLFENLNDYSYEFVYKYILQIFRIQDVDIIKEELKMTHDKLFNKYHLPKYDNLRFIFFLATLEQYFYKTKHNIHDIIDFNTINDNQQSIYFDIYMAWILINNITNQYININIKNNTPINQFYNHILLLNKNNIQSIHNYYSNKNMDYYYKENIFDLSIIYDNNLLKTHTDDYIIQYNKNISQPFEKIIETNFIHPIPVSTGGKLLKLNSYVYHKIFQYIYGILKYS